MEYYVYSQKRKKRQKRIGYKLCECKSKVCKYILYFCRLLKTLLREGGKKWINKKEEKEKKEINKNINTNEKEEKIKRREENEIEKRN